MKIFYKTRATASGGRSGTTALDDGSLSIELAPPGSGKAGANPEQLFALGYAACFGNAIKYLARWRDKGGVDDLRKAIHYIEKLIEMETADK